MIGARRALAVPYDAAALVYFNAAAEAPTDSRKALISALVKQLKSADLWAKLDQLWLATHELQLSLVNLKAPGTFDCTRIASCTFTANAGFTGNDTDMALKSNFNPSTANGNFQQDSASFFGWSNSTGQESGAGSLLGHDGAGGASIRSYLVPRFTDNNMYYRINAGAGTDDSAASTDGSGLWHMTRTAAGAHAVYRNGALFDSGTVASGALVNSTLMYLQQSSAGFSAAQIIAGGIGSGMTAADALNLYNALRPYLQAVVGIA